MRKCKVAASNAASAEARQQLENLGHGLAGNCAVEANYLGLAFPVLEVVSIRASQLGVQFFLRKKSGAPHTESTGHKDLDVAADGDVRTIRPGILDRPDAHADVDVRDQEPPGDFLEIRPGMEIVDTSDDDVRGLQRGESRRSWNRLMDGLEVPAQADFPYQPSHDHRFLPAEPNIESREPDEAVAVRRRRPIGIDTDDLAHTRMGELLHHVAAAAAQTYHGNPGASERILAILADDEELTVEVPGA